MQPYITLTNSELAELIGEHIHSERDRQIMKMKLIDGLTPSLCGCESISVRNTSTQAIDVQNANLTISYLGVRRVV